MVILEEVRCTNCEEPIAVSYVLVRRPSTDKAPHECPVCDDREAVAAVLDGAREGVSGRRPLLLSVRHAPAPPSGYRRKAADGKT